MGVVIVYKYSKRFRFAPSFNNTDTFRAAKYILGSDPGKENQC